MSKFVDYSKRSVSLPAGCKDLADMLKPSAAATNLVVSSGSSRQPTNLHNASGSPGDFLIRAEQLFGTSAPRASLAVGVDGQRLFGLYRVAVDQMAIGAWVRDDSEHAQLVKKFSEQCDIHPVHDGICNPGNDPQPKRYLMFTFPAEIARILQITSALLRVVYGLTDTSLVKFSHW